MIFLKSHLHPAFYRQNLNFSITMQSEISEFTPTLFSIFYLCRVNSKFYYYAKTKERKRM